MHWFDALQAVHRRILQAVLARRFGYLGPRARLDLVTSRFAGFENIHLGEGVFIGSHAVVSCDGVKIRVGDGTIVGPGLIVMAGDHHYSTPGLTYAAAPRGENLPVTIGRDVWLGARVTLLKGVSVGDSAIVAAGSVVTKDVPPFAVAMGVPAAQKGWRFEGEARRKHEEQVLSRLKMPPIA